MFTNEMISSFNELETAVYQYVSKNGSKVIYMRIRELAAETHVSTATILRFCRKTGCDGFTEFKVRLKLYLKEQEPCEPKSMHHSVTDFFERSLNGPIEDQMLEAARIMSLSDSIIFIGIGSSGILAEYGARYFSSLGKLSLYIKDPHYPIHTNFLQNSTTIVLSVSGENEYTVRHTHQMREAGSTIISITNNKHCTIAKMSDINLSYYVSEERFAHSNITTQVPVVYILESLARELYRLSNIQK
ncbi:MurR/RpiR family transcriptional regulator [Domibacillus sp. DTU_2020_1001157_1_SI_ALB_TIR_016]|uniref:MurR/RpiR family transcriptional regulator n=1 Tax=Domibacillus sp. DTU_2020_1001157_1_SI_ALB_TIR_016 TaxID=3077789 RepID=UPI0028E474EF|nr:MurR/RpiR family transcriptional regulator [Domibacillus sp. DTU_2020_1001157_1_SI_ALB_TIR_016]WNS80510.1 MurR/RpiR family transcriptional regulator [Domibacillus sp. DTU_2020_1001157_1_SI_ALB_TIR_016]